MENNYEHPIGMESYLTPETARLMRENFDEIEYEANGIKCHRLVPIYNKPAVSGKSNSKNKK